jgi:hypothetical protein
MPTRPARTGQEELVKLIVDEPVQILHDPVLPFQELLFYHFEPAYFAVSGSTGAGSGWGA